MILKQSSFISFVRNITLVLNYSTGVYKGKMISLTSVNEINLRYFTYFKEELSKECQIRGNYISHQT